MNKSTVAEIKERFDKDLGNVLRYEMLDVRCEKEKGNRKQEDKDKGQSKVKRKKTKVKSIEV